MRALTPAEQQAATGMVRFAVRAGYRRLRWSVPNDAGWAQPYLADVPVIRDGFLGDTYELIGARPFGAAAVVCALVRRSDGFEVLGVPREPERPARTARPRARVAVAAIGLLVPVVALAGGVAVVVEPTAGPAVPLATAPPPAGSAQWANAAKVALASVNEQLAVLADAERAWQALPPERRAGDVPGAVRELAETRVRLEQQRAALEADLATWRGLQQTTRALVETEEQLGDVTRALEQDEQSAAGEQLRERRDLLTRQREVLREQREERSTGVAEAVETPLPDPPDVTALAGSVRAVSTVEDGSLTTFVRDTTPPQEDVEPAADGAPPGPVEELAGIVPGAVAIDPAPAEDAPALGFLIPDPIPAAPAPAPPPPPPPPPDVPEVPEVPEVEPEVVDEFRRAEPDAPAAPSPEPEPDGDLPQPQDMWERLAPDGG